MSKENFVVQSRAESLAVLRTIELVRWLRVQQNVDHMTDAEVIAWAVEWAWCNMPR